MSVDVQFRDFGRVVMRIVVERRCVQSRDIKGLEDGGRRYLVRYLSLSRALLYSYYNLRVINLARHRCVSAWVMDDAVMRREADRRLPFGTLAKAWEV